MYNFSRKLQQIKYSLGGWCRQYKLTNNVVWDDVVRKCLHIQQNIASQEDVGIDREGREAGFQEVMVKLAYWKKRAKGKWNALGDTNTYFFYRSAKARKVKNEIKMIQNKEGDWMMGQNQIKQTIFDHFQEIFMVNTTTNEESQIPSGLGSITSHLTQRHIDVLNKPFTSSDIREVVFQMGDLKAPDPDGVLAIFFQKYGI